MQTQAIVAEQTSHNVFIQDPLAPPREIELTVRLEIPEATGADVGITPSLDTSMLLAWENALTQRLYQGVHGGLASVDAPLPEGGIGITIMNLRLSPPVGDGSSTGEVRQIGDALEALVASMVVSLWTGLMSFGDSSTA